MRTQPNSVLLPVILTAIQIQKSGQQSVTLESLYFNYAYLSQIWDICEKLIHYQIYS